MGFADPGAAYRGFARLVDPRSRLGKVLGTLFPVIAPAVAFTATPDLALVRFGRVNLARALPNLGAFTIIFCRNVLIYFDREMQARVINELASRLEPDGLLFIGHSEGLSGFDHPLTYVCPAVYQKRARTAASKR